MIVLLAVITPLVLCVGLASVIIKMVEIIKEGLK